MISFYLLKCFPGLHFCRQTCRPNWYFQKHICKNEFLKIVHCFYIYVTYEYLHLRVRTNHLLAIFPRWNIIGPFTLYPDTSTLVTSDYRNTENRRNDRMHTMFCPGLEKLVKYTYSNWKVLSLTNSGVSAIYTSETKKKTCNDIIEERFSA